MKKLLKRIWNDWNEKNGEMKILSLGYLAYLILSAVGIYFTLSAFFKG